MLVKFCLSHEDGQQLDEHCLQVHQVTVPAPPAPLPFILRHTRHLHKALCSADHCHGQCELTKRNMQKPKIYQCFQELFKRVIPHQCLGSVWSSKSRERDAATVVATIEQVSLDDVGVGNDCVGDNGQASPGRQHQWW